jgi:hypothetical protein
MHDAAIPASALELVLQHMSLALTEHVPGSPPPLTPPPGEPVQ